MKKNTLWMISFIALFQFDLARIAYSAESHLPEDSDYTASVQINFNSKEFKSDKAVDKNLPKSLTDAYLAAIHRSETIGIQQELLEQSHQVDNQALGALLPTVNGTFGFLEQQTAKNATGNLLYPPTQNTGKITAAQPLFRGFRDFAALRQKKHLVSSQVNALLNAARQLFYDVSTAYYNVLALKQDEENYKIQIQLNQKRLKELEGFFKIGRSQLTDVLTFKSNISSLEAQLEATRGQLEQTKETLAYLTGWNRDAVLEDKEPPPVKQDLETYLEAIENRPDVQTAVSNVKAYEEGVPIAFGAHLPSADLLANYYFFRPGALTSVTWDVQLAITVPIFQGNVVQSQVRQAESVARQYSLVLSQTRRLAEQEIRSFYDAMEADRKQSAKLSELVENSKKNYETQISYYRNGLVTNLDVLQAVVTYQDSVRQLNHARYQLRLDSAKLQAATGQRSETRIQVPK
jgi:outer membrane protein